MRMTVTLPIYLAGTNHIEIKVEGTGVMSNIVRLFLNGLSGKTTLDKVSSNTRTYTIHLILCLKA